jgi:hypothetical protein
MQRSSGSRGAPKSTPGKFPASAALTPPPVYRPQPAVSLQPQKDSRFSKVVAPLKVAPPASVARGAVNLKEKQTFTVETKPTLPPPVYPPVPAASQQKTASLATPAGSGAPPVYRPFASTSQLKPTGAPPMYRPVLPSANRGLTGSRPVPPQNRSGSQGLPAPARPEPAVAGPAVYRPNVAAPNTAVPMMRRKTASPASPYAQPLVQMSRRRARGGPGLLRTQYDWAIFLITLNILSGNDPLDNVDDLLDAPEGVAVQLVDIARAEIAERRAQRQQQQRRQRQMGREFKATYKKHQHR